MLENPGTGRYYFKSSISTRVNFEVQSYFNKEITRHANKPISTGLGKDESYHKDINGRHAAKDTFPEGLSLTIISEKVQLDRNKIT